MPSENPRIPKSLFNHKYADFLVPRWRLPHLDNDMYSCVICAKPGKGKSYTSLTLADLLDRTEEDIPRFSIDRVCFTALEFTHWLARGSSLPKGSVIILDDAGLALYSKETMGKVAVELGKAFQSMRYKNLIVILNLPAFGFLEAHVRKLMCDYIEITEKDLSKRETLLKVQELQLAPFSGDVYRHNLRWTETTTHPYFGISVKHEVQDVIRLPKPPQRLWRAYEKKKKTILDAWSIKSHNKLARLELEEAKGKEDIGGKQPVNKMREAYLWAKKNWKEYVYVSLNKKTGEKSKRIDGMRMGSNKDWQWGERMAESIARTLSRELFSTHARAR